MTDNEQMLAASSELVAAIENCSASLADFGDALRGTNDERLIESFSEPLEIARTVLNFHQHAPSQSLANDIASIRSEFARERIAREDPELGPTARLTNLRSARGGVLADLDEVLLAAKKQGMSPTLLRGTPDQVLAEHSLYAPMLSALADRLVYLEQHLKVIAAEAQPAASPSVQQVQIVNFFVRHMGIEISLARFETAVRNLFDFGVLGRAIERMGELTADFLASAEGMRHSLSDAVRGSARVLEPLWNRTAKGFRTLVKVFTRNQSPPISDVETKWELGLLSSLDRSISTNEVWVAYQPKLNLGSNRISGAEALCRWTHPERGAISPEKFIRVAEDFHRIERVTRFVVNEAVETAAQLTSSGHDTTMSVNISGQLLDNPALLLIITEALERHGLAPDRLILEVTETDRLDRSSRAYRMLQQLVGLGIRLSIDDFGTGNATIDYLRYVPANEVKIDKIFIAMMSQSKEDALLVQSMIEMAHSLDRTVVAEGVETDSALEALRALGCDEAQGFFIGRPMSKDDFIRMLNASGASRLY